MKALIILAALLTAAAASQTSNRKVFCYYDSRSYVRDSQARMLPTDLEAALPLCTHLIYGFAGIQPDNFKMVSQNPNLDIDTPHQNYRAITGLKGKHPNLKVLLSVGGDTDSDEASKYNSLLESAKTRTAFVNSGVALADQYGFDGIDLAWQFPKWKPKKIRSTFGSIWHGIKKTFGSTAVDDKEAEHREGFTALVREMRLALNVKPDKQLSISVLPNVNSSVYYDVPAIISLVDYVNLDTYDFYTPERNPKEADFSAPIYTPQDRNPLHNVDAVVSYWLQSGAPNSKILVGISTVARTWKLDSDSEVSGVPPLHADGAGEAGTYTKTSGLLSYTEVCAKLIGYGTDKRIQIRKVIDSSNRYGTYAFHLPTDTVDGLWISYEDPDTAPQKASYAMSRNLGGISISDLSMDDFRGICTGTKYPILRASSNLVNSNHV